MKNVISVGYLLLLLVAMVFCILPWWDRSLIPVAFYLCVTAFGYGALMKVGGLEPGRFWWIWAITAAIWLPQMAMM